MARILRLTTLFVVLSGHFLLAGCGNKGDLYLPEPPPEPAPAAQNAQPVDPQH